VLCVKLFQTIVCLKKKWEENQINPKIKTISDMKMKGVWPQTKNTKFDNDNGEKKCLRTLAASTLPN